MLDNRWRWLLSFGLLTILLFTACDKWDFKRVGFTQVITIGAIEVNATGAFLLGDVENIRESFIEETGFLLSTVSIEESAFRINNPDLSKYLSADQSSTTKNRAFAASVADLESGTTYFFRAYGLLMNEENPIYGKIDSFTTTGFSIAIEDFIREGSECPTEAIIRLKIGIKGVLPSSVAFGIVWQHDLFSDPTLENNVILGDQTDTEGVAIISLAVNCNEFYRVRPFIRSSGEVLYAQAVEFTAQAGGTWQYVGEIPQQFIRSQGLRSFAFDQKGYLMGLQKEGIFQDAFLTFDAKTLQWSNFSALPNGYNGSIWIPGSTDRILAGAASGLYQYFPVRDAWEYLGFLPFSLNSKIGFEVAEKIYFLDNGSMGFVRISDPETFIPLEEFPGQSPNNAFRIARHGYMGLGYLDAGIPRILSTEMWQFDLDTDAWQPVAELPVMVLTDLVFAMNCKGYVLGGTDAEDKPYPGFWEYDPQSDQWTRLADFGRGDGNADMAFVIEGIAYAGLGISFDGVERQEFWKYVPELK